MTLYPVPGARGSFLGVIPFTVSLGAMDVHSGIPQSVGNVEFQVSAMAREVMMVGCPDCGGVAVKNGIKNGGQAYRCKGCGHQFMGDPARRRLPGILVDFIKRLLVQGVKPGPIARAAGISKRQVYSYKRGIDG